MSLASYALAGRVKETVKEQCLGSTSFSINIIKYLLKDK